MKAWIDRFVTAWRAALVLSLLVFLPVPAQADIVSTEQIVQQSERERVEAFLQREGVEKQLKALGVAPETVRDRVHALTDEEIRTIAGKMDTLAAGGQLGTTEWLLIIIIIVLVIIAL